MTESLRILIANEPRAYRDAHGGMLRELLPGAEIQITEAGQIEQCFETFAPHLIICSTLTETIRLRAFAWVLLYPDDADLAVVCIDNQQSVVHGISINDLITVVERTARSLGIGDDARPRLAAEPGPVPFGP